MSSETYEKQNLSSGKFLSPSLQYCQNGTSVSREIVAHGRYMTKKKDGAFLTIVYHTIEAWRYTMIEAIFSESKIITRNSSTAF